ncbi:hypothetical protein Btru_072607 [Bulinus truncatus]|nr:hypothetical protein Btru_072607 [Bulinus truncatus]
MKRGPTTRAITKTIEEDDYYSEYSDIQDSGDESVRDDNSVAVHEYYQNCFAKIYVEIPSGSLNKNTLTLKEACRPDVLRNRIFKELKKQCQVKEHSTDEFRLRMALNIVQDLETKFSWSDEELTEILSIVVQDFKTKFLNELIDRYRPRSAVMQTVKKIVEKNKHLKNPNHENADDEDDYKENFLDDLKSGNLRFICLCLTAKINCAPEKISDAGSSQTSRSLNYRLKLFMDAVDKGKFKASLFYWTKLNASTLLHYFTNCTNYFDQRLGMKRAKVRAG